MYSHLVEFVYGAAELLLKIANAVGFHTKVRAKAKEGGAAVTAGERKSIKVGR